MLEETVSCDAREKLSDNICGLKARVINGDASLKRRDNVNINSLGR